MPIIDYDTWMQDTARFGLRRSPALEAVDKAFLDHAKLGTGASLQSLKNAFEAWTRTQGPGEAWRKSSRNHKQAVDKLAVLLNGGQDDDTAFHRGRVPDFMHEELINARLGVLYLFSRLSIQPGLFNMVLNGAIDIAGSAMEIGGASDEAQGTFKNLTKHKDKVGRFGSNLETRVGDRLFAPPTPQNISLPRGAPPSIAIEQEKVVPSDRVLREAEQAAGLARHPTLQAIAEKIEGWFDKLVDSVVKFLEKKFGSISGIAATVKKLVIALVGVIAKEAVPFLKSGLDLARSVGATIDSAVTRFRTWAEGRNVDVAQGHPATVVDSISRAMTMSLLQGLWGVLKGAGGIAMQATSFGGATIVNMVISASELLIKFIWKLVETVRFNAFCNEAMGHWDTQLGDGLHRRPFAFSEWYRSWALNMPLIAILTLNTGICGDKMRYLTMFDSDGLPVTSEQFQAGVRFLDNLKPWGAQYIKDSGFRIRSGDVLVDRLVNNLAVSHQKEKNAFDMVMEVVRA